MQLLEELRSDSTYIFKNEEEKNIIGFLLSLIPNKYHLQIYLFGSSSSYDNEMKQIKMSINDWYTECKRMDSINFIKEAAKTLTSESLKSIGLYCKMSISQHTAGEWSQASYGTNYKPSNLTANCDSADYFSGFYYESPPSLDIGILRQPSDFKYAFDAMKKNKLVRFLDKSNYKLDYHTTSSVKSYVYSSLQNSKSYVIKDDVINRIFPPVTTASGISSYLWSLVMPNILTVCREAYNNDQLSILVWKSLNFYGYNIPVSWFDILVLENDNQYRIFNDRVKSLAMFNVGTIPWATKTFSMLNKTSSYKQPLLEKSLNGTNRYMMESITGGNQTFLIAGISGLLSIHTHTVLFGIIIMLIIYLLIINYNNYQYSDYQYSDYLCNN